MNAERITQELKTQYPGKNIISLPRDNPKEILCEIDPSSKHPEYNTAIAVIDASAAHFHIISKETYKIIKGELHLFLNGKEKVLKTGEEYTIQPYIIHWAQGNETWAQVYSAPGWTAEDHILVKNVVKKALQNGKVI